MGTFNKAGKPRGRQVEEIQNVESILSAFTTREREALDEYYRQQFKIIGGRSTASKRLVILSDMHVGSTLSLYSGYGSYKITPDMEKLRDWFMTCVDRVGDFHCLLINGEPTNGPNNKNNGFQNWTSDINEQIEDAERLIRQMHYKHLIMTRGSAYHTQDGWTNDEETLAKQLGAVRYQGMFGDAVKQHSDGKMKTMQIVQETNQKQHTDYYIFFDIHGKLFNATHHVGFNRWFAYRTTAIAREMADLEFARGKYYGLEQDLDFTIRSHVHYFVQVGYTNTCGFTTPAWKFPDMHLLRGGLGGTYPAIGCVEIIVEQNGETDLRKHIMPIKKLPKPEILYL